MIGRYLSACKPIVLIAGILVIGGVGTAVATSFVYPQDLPPKPAEIVVSGTTTEVDSTVRFDGSVRLTGNQRIGVRYEGVRVHFVDDSGNRFRTARIGLMEADPDVEGYWRAKVAVVLDRLPDRIEVDYASTNAEPPVERRGLVRTNGSHWVHPGR